MDKKGFRFSNHLNKRLEERNIKESWVLETLEKPDKKLEIAENETHYFKRVIEFAEKCLKVVLNPISKTIVTAYFDRKMKKTNCK
ncbi:MAG: DUF4258 domain-containing protein [Bacteroidales bacterium]|nr:DUF4258 domain-containing protein [Bacteroidales bacterium]MBN2758350.1 DUF4258 domain-containing protein [Bacteroidales bacterium]